jgi:shikimate dehydrogenase
VTATPGRLVLLGHPVAHSLSPAFQNAALRSARLPLTYEALDVRPEAFADAFRALAAQRGAGNVTIPHKEAAARLCDRLTPLAERVGAVNTFWTDDSGALVGDNTDVGGFDAAVRGLLGRSPANARVALVGAGGAAAAVLAAVERWPGCYAAVWNRTPDRAHALSARFEGVAHAEEFLAAAIRQADLVVNATPIGLHSDDIPMNPALLRRRVAVVDLVYRRGGTPWVRLARARGLTAVDGLPMLVEQGALAFERWTGTRPDRAAMWDAVR